MKDCPATSTPVTLAELSDVLEGGIPIEPDNNPEVFLGRYTLFNDLDVMGLSMFPGCHNRVAFELMGMETVAVL